MKHKFHSLFITNSNECDTRYECSGALKYNLITLQSSQLWLDPVCGVWPGSHVAKEWQRER